MGTFAGYELRHLVAEWEQVRDGSGAVLFGDELPADEPVDDALESSAWLPPELVRISHRCAYCRIRVADAVDGVLVVHVPLYVAQTEHGSQVLCVRCDDIRTGMAPTSPADVYVSVTDLDVAAYDAWIATRQEMLPRPPKEHPAATVRFILPATADW